MDKPATLYAIARDPCVIFHRRLKAPALPHPTTDRASPSFRLNHLVVVTLAVTERVGELLERRANKLRLLPQVGGKEAVGVGNGGKGSLEGVLEGLGGAGRGSVGILDTGELEETLDGGGSNDGGTTGSGDKLFENTWISQTEAAFRVSLKGSQNLRGR